MVVGEAQPHKKAKWRMADIVNNTIPPPSYLDVEHPYPNPFYPEYPWRFDVYVEYLDGKRKIAIEVDDKVGHSSPKSHKKRDHKVEYLKSKGIELFAWPRKWIIGNNACNDEVFLEELHLTKNGREWFRK